MIELVDVYQAWLGIPPERQPPDHYTLLAIKPFEADADAITTAAALRLHAVRTREKTHPEEAQRLIQEIMAARGCLLSKDKKSLYDHTLRRLLAKLPGGDTKTPTNGTASGGPTPAKTAALKNTVTPAKGTTSVNKPAAAGAAEPVSVGAAGNSLNVTVTKTTVTGSNQKASEPKPDDSSLSVEQLFEAEIAKAPDFGTADADFSFISEWQADASKPDRSSVGFRPLRLRKRSSPLTGLAAICLAAVVGQAAAVVAAFLGVAALTRLESAPRDARVVRLAADKAPPMAPPAIQADPFGDSQRSRRSSRAWLQDVVRAEKPSAAPSPGAVPRLLARGKDDSPAPWTENTSGRRTAAANAAADELVRYLERSKQSPGKSKSENDLASTKQELERLRAMTESLVASMQQKRQPPPPVEEEVSVFAPTKQPPVQNFIQPTPPPDDWEQPAATAGTIKTAGRLSPLSNLASLDPATQPTEPPSSGPPSSGPPSSGPAAQQPAPTQVPQPAPEKPLARPTVVNADPKPAPNISPPAAASAANNAQNDQPGPDRKSLAAADLAAKERRRRSDQSTASVAPPPPPKVSRQLVFLTVADPAAPVSPVPSEDLQQKSREGIRQIYARQLAEAKEAPLRETLARELLKNAEGGQNDLATAYALLDEAQSVAATAGNVKLSLDILSAMAARFDIDETNAVLESLKSAARSGGRETRQALIAALLDAIDKSVVHDRYDLAEKLSAIVGKAATETKDSLLIERSRQRVRRLKNQQKAFAAVEPALRTLHDRSDDVDACAAVGAYRAGWLEDWKTGLPLLAAGSNAAARSAAQFDLDEPAAPGEQIQLADAWLALGEMPGVNKIALQRRAKYWFMRALPKTDGLQRAKARAALEEMLGTHGVRAEIFESGKFEQLAKSHIVRTVGMSEFLDEVPVGRSALRFKSWLVFPAAGDYAIVVHAQPGSLVRINGKPVGSFDGEAPTGDITIWVKFSSKPKPQPLMVDYVGRRDPEFSLQWKQKDGLLQEEIPVDAWYRTEAAGSNRVGADDVP